MEEINLIRGQVLYKRGDKLNGVYLIEDGEYEEIITVNESCFNEDGRDPNQDIKLAHPLKRKDIMRKMKW